MNILIWLHQRLIVPWLQRWAQKKPEYSLTQKAWDHWYLPRWVHHFGVKMTLQGIWPVIAFWLLHFPMWWGIGISVLILHLERNWHGWDSNWVDGICDTTLQVAIPVIVMNPWAIIPLCMIYWAMYPFASP